MTLNYLNSLCRNRSRFCAVCIFEKVLYKVANSKENLELANKFKDEVCLCRTKGSGRPATSQGKIEGSPNTFAKPHKVRKKNKSGNPDSFNHTLAGSKKTLSN